jgi:hypothetical protein
VRWMFYGRANPRQPATSRRTTLRSRRLLVGSSVFVALSGMTLRKQFCTVDLY